MCGTGLRSRGLNTYTQKAEPDTPKNYMLNISRTRVHNRRVQLDMHIRTHACMAPLLATLTNSFHVLPSVLYIKPVEDRFDSDDLLRADHDIRCLPLQSRGRKRARMVRKCVSIGLV